MAARKASATTSTNNKSAALSFLKEKGFTIITDAKKLDAESRALAHDIKVQDARINLYLLSEIAHIEQHRNPTRLNQFFTTIGRAGARVDAMHKMIQLFANVNFIEPGKRKEPMRDISGNLVCEYFYEVKSEQRPAEVFEKKMQEAISKPWTEWKAPPKVQDFSLAAQIKGLLERAAKRRIDPVEGAHDEIPDNLFNGLLEATRAAGVEVKLPDAPKKEAKKEEISPVN